MNLDELMAVWRTQDAAPLHDVNKTLLHLALRQDEAKLQKELRLMRRIVYVFCTAAVIGMALFLANMILLMIFRYDMNGLTGWDLTLPVVGAAAAWISARAVYVNHRAQLLRDQSFGESLRGQLKRSIAQLDHQVWTARRTSVLVVVLMGGICPTALLIASWRVNQKSISEDGFQLVSLIALCVFSVGSSVWTLRHATEKEVLPRKHRLEALLKELDGQE